MHKHGLSPSTDNDGPLLDLVQEILLRLLDPCVDVLRRAQGGALQFHVTDLRLDELVRLGPGFREQMREGRGARPPAVEGNASEGFQHFLLAAGRACRCLRNVQSREDLFAIFRLDPAPALRLFKATLLLFIGLVVMLLRFRQRSPQRICQIRHEAGNRIRGVQQSPVRDDRFHLELHVF